MKKRSAHKTVVGNSVLIERVRTRIRTPQFTEYLKQLLLELCRIDTTPHPEIHRMHNAEDQCFKVIERELGKISLSGTKLERRPINLEIAKHPYFSLLHFTKTPDRPKGFSPRTTYAGRSNLLCSIPGANIAGSKGKSIALNAHVDVVAPYFPPKVRGGTVFGRGSCDDKGPVVSIVAALKVIGEVLAEAGLRPNRNILGMFVVEEETGGNGSLSLAMDRELRTQYDSVLVGECTGLKIHPANRGAVWYRAELRPPAGVSAFEMFAFVNEELEREGLAIRAESHHELFPQRPVQTCHGIIGPFGEHPSRICGEVRFLITFAGRLTTETRRLAEDCLRSGLEGYVGAYGDKTQVLDPTTGQPLVKQHYELALAGKTLNVTVYGATGHMGAIRERDGAITKMAHLVRSLVLSKSRLEQLSGGSVSLELAGLKSGHPLVMEGGQGFVPTHEMDEVMARLRRAAELGAASYLGRVGSKVGGEQVVRMAYEKLHNVAFDGDPASFSMRNALAAAKASGLPEQEPVLGWTVSCDARLFAKEYSDLEVLTFGPGRLADAHSDHEQVELADIQVAAEFLAAFVLRQTGTIEQPKTNEERQLK
jgi:acetylornithine deacetylase/succinyl-diaminopimelate desuccinylase-like protein